MPTIRQFALSTVVTLLLSLSVAYGDNLVGVYDPKGQNADSNISWNQLGHDQTPVAASTQVHSNSGLSINVALGSPSATALVSAICATPPPDAKNCSWTGNGFSVDNLVLWTTDTANGGTGPVTLRFATPLQGAGAFIQADAPGPFTASIEAFDSSNNSLGAFTVGSDEDAVYIGVTDLSGANIASVVFSLTSCAAGSCADFALDNVRLKVSN